MSFDFDDGRLFAERVPLERLADEIGTPFYCYSAARIRANAAAYIQAFEGVDMTLCYAVKANSNQAVIRLLAQQGAGADVVSAGELRRALTAGIDPASIVFSGVAKTDDDMRYALGEGIFQFNVESEPELQRLNGVATALGRQAPVAIRVNPDIDARTHAKITTGRAINKFGIPLSRAREIYALAASMPGIRVQGIATHIGSQLTELAPFEAAFRCHRDLVATLSDMGIDITVLDIGGGLGIDYGGHPTPPPLRDYAAAARDILAPLGCRLIVEPGRSLVGDAGVLVSRVIYVKDGESRRFIILDAGMNDLLRPSFYDAYHAISPVRETPGPLVPQDVVGPVCETGDAFARNRALPRIEAGDLVAIRDVGAYGAVMASTYNTRPLVPEILVDGDEYRVVRPRVDVDALIRLDAGPDA